MSSGAHVSGDIQDILTKTRIAPDLLAGIDATRSRLTAKAASAKPPMFDVIIEFNRNLSVLCFWLDFQTKIERYSWTASSSSGYGIVQHCRGSVMATKVPVFVSAPTALSALEDS